MRGIMGTEYYPLVRHVQVPRKQQTQLEEQHLEGLVKQLSLTLLLVEASNLEEVGQRPRHPSLSLEQCLMPQAKVLQPVRLGAYLEPQRLLQLEVDYLEPQQLLQLEVGCLVLL